LIAPFCGSAKAGQQKSIANVDTEKRREIIIRANPGDAKPCSRAG